MVTPLNKEPAVLTVDAATLLPLIVKVLTFESEAPPGVISAVVKPAFAASAKVKLAFAPVPVS